MQITRGDVSNNTRQKSAKSQDDSLLFGGHQSQQLRNPVSDIDLK